MALGHERKQDKVKRLCLRRSHGMHIEIDKLIDRHYIYNKIFKVEGGTLNWRFTSDARAYISILVS